MILPLTCSASPPPSRARKKVHKRSKEKEREREKESKDADAHSSASSSCVSLDSIPAALAGPTPPYERDTVCNGDTLSLERTSRDGGSSDIDKTSWTNDRLWTDPDLLGTAGGVKEEEEEVEGVWHGGNGEVEGAKFSIDGLSVEEEGGRAQEWDVDSTLTSHMIDHVTDHMTEPGRVEEEEVTGQDEGALPNHVDYHLPLKDQVEGGGAEWAGHHPQQDELDASHVLQDRQELMDRQDTLVAEEQEIASTLTSSNPFFTPSPPLSPNNPFMAATPPLRVATPPLRAVAGGETVGPNPFLVAPPPKPAPTNPFEAAVDTHPLEHQASQPLNPFHSDSAHNSPPPSFSSNPFDVDDDHAHTDAEVARPLADELDYQDMPSLPSLPDTPPPLPAAPSHNPLPPSPSPPAPSKHLRRPDSASTTRSRTTEDSGSSIDLSPFMDTTPPSSDQLSPSHLTSPEEDFFAPEVHSYLFPWSNGSTRE